MYTVGLDKFKSFLILYSQKGGIANKSEISISEGTDNYEKVNTENIDHTKEIIFGSLLGDGRLELPPRGTNARFGFTQAEGQRDYFIFVCESLSTVCSAKYREYSYVDKRTGKTYKSLNF
jgi:hypothetical protein